MKKILLIEDDKANRENIAELLELANYTVITASNGKTGVLEAKKTIPDIIICDILMPELSGYGVLQILSKKESTKNIPFIFLSAKTEYHDIRKGMNLGADDYLTKPFDESELFSAIESRLAKVAIIEEANEKEIPETSKVPEEAFTTLEHLKKYFIDNIEEYSFSEGESIYREGDNSNYVYLIYKGVVKTYKIDEQGKELITGIYKEQDFFGITSFLHNIPYEEYATAIENTKILRQSKNDLKTLLQNNHELTLELVDHLSDNVSEIKEHLLDMAYSSVRKKTANTILQFTEKIKSRVGETINISRSDLASIAGIATETFIRTLSEFRKDGIIEIHGRNIKILDIEKLKKVK